MANERSGDLSDEQLEAVSGGTGSLIPGGVTGGASSTSGPNNTKSQGTELNVMQGGTTAVEQAGGAFQIVSGELQDGLGGINVTGGVLQGTFGGK